MRFLLAVLAAGSLGTLLLAERPGRATDATASVTAGRVLGIHYAKA